MTYFDELTKAMTWLGEQKDTFFIGQSVGVTGTAMYNTLSGVDMGKRLELPIFEETQLGMSIGLSLEGFVPVSIFPRWNFLLLATNQIVNHLDKYPLMSNFKNKVIVRTGLGSVLPLDPQPAHRGDFTEAFRLMCKTVEFVRLNRAEDVVPAYQKAYHADHSTVLVEVSDFLNNDFHQNYAKFRESYDIL